MKHLIYLNREVISHDMMPKVNMPSPNQAQYYTNKLHARWRTLDNKINDTLEMVNKNSFYFYEQMHQLKKLQSMMQNDLKNQLITEIKNVEGQVQEHASNLKISQHEQTNKLANIERTLRKEQNILSKMMNRQDNMAKRLVTQIRNSYEKVIGKIDNLEEEKVVPIHSVLLAISPSTKIANVVICGQLMENLIFINFSPAHRLATFQQANGGLIVIDSEQINAIGIEE